MANRSLIPHWEKWKIKLFSRLPNLYIKQTKYGTTINKLHNFEIIIYASKVYSNNKNIKTSSFKSSENIQKKEGGPDRSVSDNQSSSVTLNELAMKARKDAVISGFSKEVIH